MVVQIDRCGQRLRRAPAVAPLLHFPDSHHARFRFRRRPQRSEIHRLSIRRKSRRKIQILPRKWQRFRFAPFPIAPARNTQHSNPRKRRRRIQLHNIQFFAVRTEHSTRFIPRRRNHTFCQANAARANRFVSNSSYDFGPAKATDVAATKLCRRHPESEPCQSQTVRAQPSWPPLRNPFAHDRRAKPKNIFST